MNPEKQRIAIAKACGWINQGEIKRVKGLEHRWTLDRKNFGEIPDYLNNLNAMHEAEKLLTWPQITNYIEAVNNLCDWMPLGEQPSIIGCNIHATASQRAEAFLKALGIWEDGE